jgi:hypothetical protein
MADEPKPTPVEEGQQDSTMQEELEKKHGKNRPPKK